MSDAVSRGSTTRAPNFTARCCGPPTPRCASRCEDGATPRSPPTSTTDPAPEARPHSLTSACGTPVWLVRLGHEAGGTCPAVRDAAGWARSALVVGQDIAAQQRSQAITEAAPERGDLVDVGCGSDPPQGAITALSGRLRGADSGTVGSRITGQYGPDSCRLHACVFLLSSADGLAGGVIAGASAVRPCGA